MDELIQISHPLKARFRASVARNPEERAAVNWAQVMSDAQASLQDDWSLACRSRLLGARVALPAPSASIYRLPGRDGVADKNVLARRRQHPELYSRVFEGTG